MRANSIFLYTQEGGYVHIKYIKPILIKPMNNTIHGVSLHYGYVFPTGDNIAAILDNEIVCLSISDEIPAWEVVDIRNYQNHLQKSLEKDEMVGSKIADIVNRPSKLTNSIYNYHAQVARDREKSGFGQ